MTLDGHIVSHDDPRNPYKVVFKDGDDILAEWPVDSMATGQRRMESALRAIGFREIASSQTDSAALAEQEQLTR